MADPYWRYSTASPRPLTDRGNAPKPSFPGYLSSDAPAVTAYSPYNSTELRGTSDSRHKDILPFRSEANGRNSSHLEPSASGLNVGGSIRGYPSAFEDTNFPGERWHVAPSIPDVDYERPNSIGRSVGPPVPADSNILFVDGLPTDCTRREIGSSCCTAAPHLPIYFYVAFLGSLVEIHQPDPDWRIDIFWPFIGFKDLKLVHKEPRHHGDKARVLCFVEFSDVKCALTARQALQDYKIDDRKPESPLLKIHFAHFPFRLPSERKGPRVGGSHDVLK